MCVKDFFQFCAVAVHTIRYNVNIASVPFFAFYQEDTSLGCTRSADPKVSVLIERTNDQHLPQVAENTELKQI